MRAYTRSLLTAAALGLALAPTASLAQSATALPPPPRAAPLATTGPSATVSLVRQDGSDCLNSTVTGGDPVLDRGVAMVTRNPDGTTSVKVAITASPNTTYHFYLKCVRQLGDVSTGDEGEGSGAFNFPTSQAPGRFAFDMYPEGAPSGNKFQSVTVALP